MVEKESLILTSNPKYIPARMKEIRELASELKKDNFSRTSNSVLRSFIKKAEYFCHSVPINDRIPFINDEFDGILKKAKSDGLHLPQLFIPGQPPDKLSESAVNTRRDFVKAVLDLISDLDSCEEFLTMEEWYSKHPDFIKKA